MALMVAGVLSLAVAAPVFMNIYQRGAAQLPSPEDAAPPLALPAPVATATLEPAREDATRPLDLDDLPVMGMSEAPMGTEPQESIPLSEEREEDTAAEDAARPRRWPWQR